MKRRSLHIAAVLLLACGIAHAQKGLEPGEYLDGSGGYLILKPGKGGTAFTLHTVGGNRHICDAQGTIGANNLAVLKPDPQTTCTLRFVARPEGVEVEVKDKCPAYCGARASLDGIYRKPDTGCDRASVKKSRAEFKKLYDRKSYAEARKTLEPVVKRCQKFVEDRDDGWMRNDLAVTLHKLGDGAECRRTLEPLAAMAAKSDASIREDLPPNEADAMMSMVRATRTNLKLCEQAAKAQ
ncbi:MAG TPA: hypothetical protein VHP37_14520 [Burkholderiales bacterium]|nr:hypothetical protein [Burkholderiales bacterium]